MTAIELQTSSADETRNTGTRLGRCLARGDVLALCGPLGSGKTVFMQGLARGLGTDPETPVTSPSFVILHEYPGPVPLYHFDFYRLKQKEEVRSIGYEEYFDGDGVCAVEWADKFKEIFSEDTIWITFSWKGENKRHIKFSPGPAIKTERWSGLVKAI